MHASMLPRELWNTMHEFHDSWHLPLAGHFANATHAKHANTINVQVTLSWVAWRRALAAQIHPAFQRLAPRFRLMLIVPFRNHATCSGRARRRHRQTGCAKPANCLVDDLVALLGLHHVYVLPFL